MKKILLLSLFALMASISQAQIWVGGSLGIKVDDDKKKTTIPLKTVNTIIRDVLGDKIKVSKSFVKLVS